MPKARSEQSFAAEKMYLNGKKLVEIASQLNISEGTVRSWKNRYKWNDKRDNSNVAKKKCNVAKKRGGQPGNKNALYNKGGAPRGNQNSRKHGLFSKYLPADTLDIINNMPLEPLNMLWDQIQIAYAAILRSQQIMHVTDRNDKTIEKVEEKRGKIMGERWEVQEAWDKQASFLKAQSRAQQELRSLIKQYDDMLHTNWHLASKEQKARVQLLKAQVDKIKLDVSGDDPASDDGFLEALSGSAGDDWSGDEDGD